MTKSRIWELDALRGVCILAMVVVHGVYDLVELYRLVEWDYPPAFRYLKDWGGYVFLVLSGVCVTLGSHPVKRGALVMACGGLCTLVTFVLYRLGWLETELVIRFGVLHCLGSCMLLWPVFRKIPGRALAWIGGGLSLLGLRVRKIRVAFDWLSPLGIRGVNFRSGDYFPLLMGLGMFLLGTAPGRRLYAQGRSLLPESWGKKKAALFFSRCGRLSLPIYLLHQPVLSGICMTVQALSRV